MLQHSPITLPPQEEPMAFNTLPHLLRHGLAECHDAARQLLVLLDVIETSTDDGPLRERIRRHRDEARRQIENAERCCELLGSPLPAGHSGVARELAGVPRRFRDAEALPPLIAEAVVLDALIRLERDLAVLYRGLGVQARTIGNDDVNRLLEQCRAQCEDMAGMAEERRDRVLAEVYALR